MVILGDTSCLDGELLSPVLVTMSTVRSQKWGPDNCIDGDHITFCRTDKEQLPTITLDYGTVVHFATVR